MACSAEWSEELNTRLPFIVGILHTRLLIVTWRKDAAKLDTAQAARGDGNEDMVKTRDGTHAVPSLRIFMRALAGRPARNLILFVMRWFARDTWPIFGLSDFRQERLDRRTRVHASEFVQEFGGEDLRGHVPILRQADTLLEPRVARSVAIWREHRSILADRGSF